MPGALHTPVQRGLWCECRRATPSARAEQTASLHRIADNTYRGTFYNREYGVSGTILVRLNGKTHNVRLTSEAGSASLKFSR